MSRGLMKYGIAKRTQDGLIEGRKYILEIFITSIFVYGINGGYICETQIHNFHYIQDM